MSIPAVNSSLPPAMPTSPRPPGVADAPGAGQDPAQEIQLQAGAEPAAPVTSSAETAAAADPSKPRASSSLEDVQRAMEEVRNAITPVAQDLLFSIDEDTGKTIVKVVDASTDEVIRQIPSEEIITIAKALDNLQGLLLQQKA